MDSKRILQIIILALLVVVAWLLWPKLQRPTPQEVIKITDFTSCQLGGGEILQTDPVTCKAPNGQTFTEDENPLPEVVLDFPKYGDLVTSPLDIRGKARGTWFFEANIPVTLKDDKGNILVKQGFQAIDDWMTVDYVNFSGTLTFDPGDAQYGVLIIEKDNPSGLPEFDSSFAIPVRFK